MQRPFHCGAGLGYSVAMPILARSLLVVLALGLAAAAPAPANKSRPVAGKPVDWLQTIVLTLQGYRIGNPAAKVRLVEYGSFTCPHCRAFQQEGLPVLRKFYIATGKINFEFRSFVRNGPDLAASLLVACNSPARQQAENVEMLFARAPEWIEPFSKLDDATVARLSALPETEQVAALGKAGGLVDFMALHGVPAAAGNRCLADKAAIDRLTDTVKTAVETEQVQGTPGFLINGTYQTMPGIPKDTGIATWVDLEPRLIEALR